MKILITGGAGFIGSHLVEAFQDIAREIRVLDNFRTGKSKNLAGFSHTLINGSVSDSAVINEAVRGIDCVFHLAALGNVPECLKNPNDCRDTNINGLKNVLDCVKKWGVPRFIFPSSASVYGLNPPSPTREDTPLSPLNPYARSKAKGECLVDTLNDSGSCSTCSLRLFNVFGPRQAPDGGYAAVIPLFISRALTNEPIEIHGDGLQTRDFISVRDVSSALIHAAKHPGLMGAFNVGTSKTIRIIDLANRIIRLTGSSSEIVFQEPRATDARSSSACCQKFINTGWKPSDSLVVGLCETIASFAKKVPVTTPKCSEGSHFCSGKTK